MARSEICEQSPPNTSPMNSNVEHVDHAAPVIVASVTPERVKSTVRTIAWTIWGLAPILLLPSANLTSIGPIVLVSLWCLVSLYFVMVPSRVADADDPADRRTAAKVALWLFGIVAAFVAWHYALDFVWKLTSPQTPPWLSRLVLIPGDLGAAIALFFALLALAPATGVFVLSQRRFLVRPESGANRILLFLGIPAIVLVTAGAYTILVALSCVV